ncbi:MAG: hypothetical protein DIU78_012850 [Pseudomonadota bacterium]
MPPIPSVTERVRDFGLGVTPPASMTPVIFGVSSQGDTNKLEQYATVQALKDARGEGPAVETAAHVLSQGGGPIYFIGADPTIAASNGSVQYAGTGPAITVSGSATLDARVRVKIVERGIRGTAKFVYSCDDFEGALDSERTYSETLTVPTGGTFAVPNLGISLVFAAPAMGSVTASGGGPAVTLTGTPAGDYQLVIEITKAGAVSTAEFRWSIDGGESWEAEDVVTAATVALGSTGITANFAAGSYVLAETYSAETNAYVPGDEYYVDVECPAWNAGDLAEAFAVLSGNEPWRFFVAVTSKGTGDETAHALLATALQAHLNTLANASKYRAGMIPTEQGEAASDVVTAFSSVSAIRCLLAYGQQRQATMKPFPGFGFPVTHALDSFAAVATAALPSTDLKRVASGPLPAVIKIFHDESQDPTGLDAAKISTLRTWDGKDGFYITQAWLKSPSGSDFTFWPRRILMDIACETVHQMQIDFIGRGVRLNPDGSGTIHELDAIAWEEKIGEALAAQLLTPNNAEGFGGHVQDVRYRISRTHNVRATGTIIGFVGILPLEYASFIETELGFVVALPAPQAA